MKLISLTFILCLGHCLKIFCQEYAQETFFETIHVIPEYYCSIDGSAFYNDENAVYFLTDKYITKYACNTSSPVDSIELKKLTNGIARLIWSKSGPVLFSIDSTYYSPLSNKGELIFLNHNLVVSEREKFQIIPSGLSILPNEMDQIKFVTRVDSGFCLTFGFQRRQLLISNGKFYSTNNIRKKNRFAWDITSGEKFGYSSVGKSGYKFEYSLNDSVLFRVEDFPELGANFGMSAFISDRNIITRNLNSFYIFSIDNRSLTQVILENNNIPLWVDIYGYFLNGFYYIDHENCTLRVFNKR